MDSTSSSSSRMNILSTLVALLLLGGTEEQDTQKVTQHPTLVSAVPNASVNIRCRQTRSESYMYWYRQEFPQEPKLLILSVYGAKPDRQANVSERLTAERKELNEIILDIVNVTLADTGVYFCATSDGGPNNPAHFGGGTKLTVLERDPQEPKVTIFEPSEEEIKKKLKATLVCLAYDFYPDHVRITWEINGKAAKPEDFKTDDYPIKNEENKLYTMSSRLRLSLHAWFNPTNKFTCVTTFSLNDTQINNIKDDIVGRVGCGVTPESYRKDANMGKFTFTLLLCKSVLYGLIVMLIVWKAKPATDKCFN